MIELHITLSDDGRLAVDGPIHNKVVCLGILDIARDVVKQYAPSLVQPVPANGNILRKV